MGIIDNNVSGINSYIFIFAEAIIAIFIVYVRSKIIDLNKNDNKKKSRLLWINFLRSNKNIDNCIEDFNEINDKKGDVWAMASTFIGIILGSVILIEFVDLLRLITNDFGFASQFAAVIVNLIPFILVISLFRYIRIIDDGKKLINESGKILHFWIAILWFNIGSSLFTILLGIVSILGKREVPNGIIVSFIVVIFTFLLIYFCHEFYMKRSKAILNNQYLKDFPKLQILTKVGEINGKIQDIFHENLIIIDDNGTNIATEWNEIIILKLQAKSIKPLESYFK